MRRAKGFGDLGSVKGIGMPGLQAKGWGKDGRFFVAYLLKVLGKGMGQGRACFCGSIQSEVVRLDKGTRQKNDPLGL